MTDGTGSARHELYKSCLENGIPPAVMVETPIPQLVALVCFDKEGRRLLSRDEAFEIIARKNRERKAKG